MRVLCGASSTNCGSSSTSSRDRLHGFDEEIEFFFRLALGWLDHQRAGHDQRKRRGVGMKSVVDEALGDVHGLDAFLRLQLVAEDDFVHRTASRKAGRKRLRVPCGCSSR